jgi:hypothetical protein
MTAKEKELVEAIQAAPDEVWIEAFAKMDEELARTDKWAFREFTGQWPTKADKGI